MPNSLPEAETLALKELILRGRKIEAIKRLRASTGLGLRDAKNAIEAMEASLHKDFPEKLTVGPKHSGCLGSIALIGLGGIALAYWTIGI